MTTQRDLAAYLLGLSLLIGAAGTPSSAVARPRLFELDPIADQNARQHHLLTTRVTYRIEDPACFESLAFSLDQAPPTMRIRPSQLDQVSGEINWIPVPFDAGQSFPVVVRARGVRSAGSVCGGGVDEQTVTYNVAVRAGSEVFVGSFSVLGYNTYLKNPEVGAAAPNNAFRGFHIGRLLRDSGYDFIGLTETFDNKGREGLWDQINSYCINNGDAADNPAGGNNCLYPAWVLNWPSASNGECKRNCTETGGLSILSKRPFIWNSSDNYTQHYAGPRMCGSYDCYAGKGFLRVEVQNLGGIDATHLQIYLTHTQANYHDGNCSIFAGCGRWYEVRERQFGQMANHSRYTVREGDGPIVYIGDLNVPARDFPANYVHKFFQVYEARHDDEYDRMLGIFDHSGTGRGIRDAYRELHPPPVAASEAEILETFTSNPTLNGLTEFPWHGRIDYQLIDDSRSCYRLVPVSAEHPRFMLNPPDVLSTLSDHFATSVKYNVYRKTDVPCRLVNAPLTLQRPVPRVFPSPYGSGMSLAWSAPTPGTAYYEIQYSVDGGASWALYTNRRSVSEGPWINHHGNRACGEYQYCLESARRYDYRVRALDAAGAPLADWSKPAGAVSRDWADLRPNRPPTVGAPASVSVNWRDGVQIRVEASDPDVADKLEISFEGLSGRPAVLYPARGTGAVEALLLWQPGPGDVGGYRVRFIVRDEHGVSAETSTALTVWANPNDPCPTCLLPPASP